jgi:hypothetical protein
MIEKMMKYCEFIIALSFASQIVYCAGGKMQAGESKTS